MRISELVSDWELDEIRDELRHGNAPDVVAFRHGVPLEAVRNMRPKGDHTKFDNRWTKEETIFVRDNYPNHGRRWDGWKMLKRHTWDAIRMRAYYMGVRRKKPDRGEKWRKTNGMFFATIRKNQRYEETE